LVPLDLPGSIPRAIGAEEEVEAEIGGSVEGAEKRDPIGQDIVVQDNNERLHGLGMDKVR